MDIFKWEENCIICGKVALNDSDRDKNAEARTIKLKNNIISLCKQRNHEWAGAIEQRISGCIAFVASKTVYHPRCFASSFVLLLDI